MSYMKKRRSIILLLILSLVFSGISLPAGGVINVYAAGISNVYLSPDSLNLSVDQSEHVSIITTPANAYYAISVSYGTSACKVSLDESGMTVTGTGVGSSSVQVKITDQENTTYSLTLDVTVSGSGVKKRTKKQIRNYIKKNKISFDALPEYSSKPSTSAPYSAGKLKKSTQKSALKTLKSVRYIAGLDAGTRLDSGQCKLAQAASVVNAANGSLSHTPSKSAGMSEDLYKQGYEGASSSNIAWGFRSLNNTIIHGWMADDDESNIDRVGHRRWMLNPTMGSTGFGMAGTFSAMYSFDQSCQDFRENVMWPAQVMPIEYFDDHYPWSVSTGRVLDPNKVKVTLTRISDKKKWTFSAGSKGSGYFNVNNAGYGLQGCIIFRPDGIHYKNGDKFKVKITGLPTGKLEYKVEFFDL